MGATVSREPVSRLISAYFYCRNRAARDPLCGSSRIDVNDATIHQFAEHWGNYLFRELLWYPELNQLAASRPDYNSSAVDCANTAREPWLQLKDKLNGGDDLRTKSGAMNFKAVKNSLAAGKLYDFVGVLERWNETMAIFDKRVELAENRTWQEVGQHHQSHGSEAWDKEEKIAL